MNETDLLREQINCCLACQKGAMIIRKSKSFISLYNRKAIQKSKLPIISAFQKIFSCKSKDEYNQIFDNQIRPQSSEEFSDFFKQLQLFRTSDKFCIEQLIDVKRVFDIKYSFDKNEKAIIKALFRLVNTTSPATQDPYDQYFMLVNFINAPDNFPLGNDIGSTVYCLAMMSRIVNSCRDFYFDQTSDEIRGSKLQKIILNSIQNLTVHESAKDACFSKQPVRNGYLLLQNYLNNFHDYKNCFNQNCGGKLFFYCLEKPTLTRKALLESPKLQKSIRFWQNVCTLPDNYNSIATNYLLRAPKKIGPSLTRIMKMQGISAQTLSRLCPDKFITNSTIEKMCNTNNLQKHTMETINEVCFGLLISKDVLFTGTGTRYGNWNNLLDDESKIYIMQELSSTEIKGKRETTNFIYEAVHSIFKSPNRESIIQEIWKDEQTSICLYDPEEYYFYLLNPKEADLLLSILLEASQLHSAEPSGLRCVSKRTLSSDSGQYHK